MSSHEPSQVSRAVEARSDDGWGEELVVLLSGHDEARVPRPAGTSPSVRGGSSLLRLVEVLTTLH